MIIDWFTVGVQALNFVILIYLMKRFLYGPILNAIDARERQIVMKLKNADDKNAQAQKMYEDFRQKNNDFDQDRIQLRDEMNQEIKNEHKRLFEEINKEANELKLKRQESLDNSTKNAFEKIKLNTEKEVFEITRKVLRDLSTSTLEESICQKFISRLQDLNPQEKKIFIEAMKSETVIMRTNFTLSQDQRNLMEKFINEFFSSKVSLLFEQSTNVIGGVELSAQGSKVSWSIGDYLKTMEQSLVTKEVISEL